MTTRQARPATPTDAPLVTRMLVDAFHEDPMWGAWAFPDPATRRRHRETVFRLLVEGALRYPEVWLTAEETAVAVWIPPGGTELSTEAPATPAYLEAADELVSLYERFGFRVTTRLALDGGPTVNGMWRDPDGQPEVTDV